MSNSAKMSLEEKLVQSIKATSLASLVDDEDALLDLTRRAVNEALFQPRRIAQDYGRYTETDSPVVATARTIAQEAVKTIVAEEVAALIGNADARKVIRQAIAGALPNALRDGVVRMMTDTSEMTRSDMMASLREAGVLET